MRSRANFLAVPMRSAWTCSTDIPVIRDISQASNAALVNVGVLTGPAHTGTLTFQNGTLTATNGSGLQFDNADGALKPDMFGDVVIQQPARQVVVVPDSAVLQTGTRSVVFVVKGDGTFEPREVSVGTKSEQVYEVRSGLKAGEKVVTQANFLIDSESRLKAALAEMGSGARQH